MARPDPEDWLAARVGDRFTLTPASADASFRRYFRVRTAHATRILMDAPPEHEDSRPFVAVATMFVWCSTVRSTSFEFTACS